MDQYISFYNANKQQIEAHAPQLMNAVREQAFEQYCHQLLTHTDPDYYRFFDLQKAFSPNYGLNIMQLPPHITAPFRCNIPSITDNTLYLINDQLLPFTNPLPQGLTICSMKQACEQYPQLVTEYYNRQTDKQDGLQALNTTFAQNGIFIHLAQGITLTQPIQIINLLQANQPTLTQPHNLIILEPNSSAQIIVCDHTTADNAILQNSITEITLQRAAKCHYYHIESTAPHTTNLHTLHINQQQDTETNVALITLHNGQTRNNTTINLAQQNARTQLSCMSIGTGDTLTDNATTINHLAPDTTSNQLIKYILNHQAQANFLGRIRVAEGATGTQAYQINRNICLTNEARVRTKPQLEIYNDDVKCNHGATIGQLDDDALFYMQQRGIPQNEAKQLLLAAFVSDILQNIQLPPLRDKIQQLTCQYLRGEQLHCRECDLAQQCRKP